MKKKMKKVTISVRLREETKSKLDRIRLESGLATGVIVDALVNNIDLSSNQLFFGADLKSDYLITDGVVDSEILGSEFTDYPYEMTEVEQRRFDSRQD